MLLQRDPCRLQKGFTTSANLAENNLWETQKYNHLLLHIKRCKHKLHGIARFNVVMCVVSMILSCLNTRMFSFAILKRLWKINVTYNDWDTFYNFTLPTNKNGPSLRSLARIQGIQVRHTPFPTNQLNYQTSLNPASNLIISLQNIRNIGYRCSPFLCRHDVTYTTPIQSCFFRGTSFRMGVLQGA